MSIVKFVFCVNFFSSFIAFLAMLDISLHTIAIYQNYLCLEHKYFRFYYTILEHVRNCVQRIRCTLSNCQFDITKVRFQKKQKTGLSTKN